MKKMLILLIVGCTFFVTICNSNSNPRSNSSSNSSCKIKGNISINSGRKIYHIPGQQDYEKTRIQPEHGERWFCSEAEAIKAGWIKAPK